MNAYAARQLEERRFDFQLYRYVIDQNLEQADEVRRLCELVELGLLRDPEGRFRRLMVEGLRPCGMPESGGPFSVPAARERLESELGLAANTAVGPIDTEWGFMKVDGRLVPQVELPFPEAAPGEPDSIRVEQFGVAGMFQSPNRLDRSSMPDHLNIAILRNGRLLQAQNLYVLTDRQITIGIVNRGPAEQSLVGENYVWVAQSTALRIADEHIIQMGAGRAHDRISPAQLDSLQRTLSALCERFGSREVHVSTYVQQTVGRQGYALPSNSCGVIRSGDQLSVE